MAWGNFEPSAILTTACSDKGHSLRGPRGVAAQSSSSIVRVTFSGLFGVFDGFKETPHTREKTKDGRRHPVDYNAHQKDEKYMVRESTAPGDFPAGHTIYGEPRTVGYQRTWEQLAYPYQDWKSSRAYKCERKTFTTR